MRRRRKKKKKRNCYGVTQIYIYYINIWRHDGYHYVGQIDS